MDTLLLIDAGERGFVKIAFVGLWMPSNDLRDFIGESVRSCELSALFESFGLFLDLVNAVRLRGLFELRSNEFCCM